MTTALERLREIFDHCRMRKRAYLLSLKSPAGQVVLQDLAAYCRANETCMTLNGKGDIDQQLTWAMEGRREVWLRIQQHLNLTPDQLATLYSGQTFISEGEDNADRS